jgi:hypothetical protein
VDLFLLKIGTKKLVKGLLHLDWTVLKGEVFRFANRKRIGGKPSGLDLPEVRMPGGPEDLHHRLSGRRDLPPRSAARISRRAGERVGSIWYQHTGTSILVFGWNATFCQLTTILPRSRPTAVPALSRAPPVAAEAERGAALPAGLVLPNRRRPRTVTPGSDVRGARHEARKMPRLSAGRRAPYVSGSGTPRQASRRAPLGTPRSGRFPHRAPPGALPPRLRGDKEGSVPGALRGHDRSTGPAKRWLFDK